MENLIGGYLYIDREAIESRRPEKELTFPWDGGNYSRKVYTNNGSTATVYALQNGVELKKEDIVLLPDYLCGTIVDAFKWCGEARRQYYRIDENMEIDGMDLDRKAVPGVRLIYVVHYFGQPQPKRAMDAVLRAAERCGAYIMEDITLASFAHAPGRIGVGHYMVSGIRKWFPVTDGGLLAVRNGAPLKEKKLLPPYDMVAYEQMQMAFVKDGYDRQPGRDIADFYRQELEVNSRRYLDLAPKGVTPLSNRIMRGWDCLKDAEKRTDNYRYYQKQLSKVPQIKIMERDISESSPYGIVILCPRRDELDRYLRRNRVQAQIQWFLPEDVKQPGEAAMYFYDHNLMLQCDFRFDAGIIDRSVEAIRRFFS